MNEILRLPSKFTKQQWIDCGKRLCEIEREVGWAIGEWWNRGEAYGDRVQIASSIGFAPGTCRVYGHAASHVLNRFNTLDFSHHLLVAMDMEQQRKWLERAVVGNEGKRWTTNELKTAIAREAAFARTKQVELDAEALGKFVVLYADPPWRYEHPPMGGSNRSIENHYPTMALEEICALPIRDVAHNDSVLFMWATNPKLYECMKVLDAWGFDYRTDMVWVKDKIGMGYYVREKHETLLIARRGEFPCPATDARPESIVVAPRLDHSAKPPILYEIIDCMYPKVHKLELFARAPKPREYWSTWGNQADNPTST